MQRAEKVAYTGPVNLVCQRLLLLLGAALVCRTSLDAQTYPAAQRRFDLSAFALFSGTYTGLGSSPLASGGGFAGPGGRNLTFSLGADLGFYSYRGFQLGAEVRGAYPLDSGQVDGQKSILAGVRVTREPSGTGLFARVRPYGTVLAGRGQIEYQSGGYLTPGILFFNNNSAVYAGGFGAEADVSRSFSIRGDAQFQRWNTPVTQSGILHTSQGGIGIVYRYGAGSGPR